MGAGNKINLGGMSFDSDFIMKLVERYESKTDAEIVPMVVAQSDRYPAAALRIAIFIFMLLLGLNIIFEFVLELTTYHLIGLTLLSLLISMGLGQIFWVKRIFLGEREIEEEVSQKAMEVFFTRDLHHTSHRGAVLLFISLLEHRVKILCDHAVKDIVSKEEWDGVIRSMTPFLKQKKLQSALDCGIQNIGELLILKFPSSGDNSSEGQGAQGEIVNIIIE